MTQLPQIPREDFRRISRQGVPLLAAAAAVLVLAYWPGGSRGAGGTPTCFGKPATIAYPDSDNVAGTPNADVIVTGRGTQLVQGRRGNDRICTNGGDDVISGGDGRDKVNGGHGNDNMVGNKGDDLLKGAPGRDLLDGKKGFDRCFGGKGRDLASPSRCERIRGADS